VPFLALRAFHATQTLDKTLSDCKPLIRF
jgi:hypothetical protein